MKSHVERRVASPEGMRAYQQERAIYEVTTLIEDEMDRQGVSRSDLAAKLGKTKGWVTQLLDGEANKTIRTVADVFSVLGCALHFRTGPIDVVLPEPILRIAGQWEDEPETPSSWKIGRADIHVQ